MKLIHRNQDGASINVMNDLAFDIALCCEAVAMSNRESLTKALEILERHVTSVDFLEMFSQISIDRITKDITEDPEVELAVHKLWLRLRITGSGIHDAVLADISSELRGYSDNAVVSDQIKSLLTKTVEIPATGKHVDTHMAWENNPLLSLFALLVYVKDEEQPS